jgi:hypothetical protein
MDLTNRVTWRELNFFGSEFEKVADSDEKCSEPSGFIKFSKIPAWLMTY